MRTALGLLLLAVSTGAGAETLTEDFKTATHRDPSGIAVWNLAETRAHVPYFADTNAGLPNGPDDKRINIGDGSDGAFDSTTFATFDPAATATKVTLDTSKIYQFTTFTLPAGVTLTGSGSSALRIRVQGAVDISGTINLNGGGGADGSADTSLNPAGGTSCCGGGAGGAGASNGTGSDGVSGDLGNIGSGKAGSKSVNDGGGGGGAGYRTDGDPGEAGVGGPGKEGKDYTDNLLSKLQGGSGGGGGGAGANSNGAGGGGGGGALQIECGGTLTVRAGGSLYSKGGAGGAVTDVTRKGGGGGGGSGGSIALFAGGQFTNNGSIRATGGAGGVGAGTGGNGGAARDGQVRFVNAQNDGWIGGDENPLPNMANFGQVQYDTSGSTVLLSKSYDIANSNPTYNSSTISGTFPAATTTVLEWAGSSDDFASDNTGFVPTSNLSTLNGKRYVKFRITMNSTNPAQSPDVRSVTLDYTPREQGSFTFALAGCARVGPGRGSSPWGWLGLCAYLVSLPILAGRRRGRPRREKRTRRC